MYVMDLKETMLVIWKPGKELGHRMLTCSVVRDPHWAQVWIPKFEAFMTRVVAPLQLEVSRWVKSVG